MRPRSCPLRTDIKLLRNNSLEGSWRHRGPGKKQREFLMIRSEFCKSVCENVIVPRRSRRWAGREVGGTQNIDLERCMPVLD